MSNFWKNSIAKASVGQEYRRVDERKLFTTTPTAPLYHVSMDDKLPSTLVPRLPYGSELSDKDTKYTEPDIPRVSFSSSVIGCLRGIYINLESVFEQANGRDVNFVVYELVPGDARFVSPETLARRAVHDAEITQEWWALDPVQIKLKQRMTLRHDRNGEWIKYKPFGGKEMEHSPLELTIFDRV